MLENVLFLILFITASYFIIQSMLITHRMNLVKQKITYLNYEIRLFKDIETYSTNFFGFEPSATFKDDEFKIIEEYRANRVYDKMLSKYEDLLKVRSRLFEQLKYAAIPLILLIIILTIIS